MEAYGCTYDEYLDTPNGAVMNLLLTRRAINDGHRKQQEAQQVSQTPHIG